MSKRPCRLTKRMRRDVDAMMREMQRLRHRHALRMLRNYLRLFTVWPRWVRTPVGLTPKMIRYNRERRQARLMRRFP